MMLGLLNEFIRMKTFRKIQKAQWLKVFVLLVFLLNFPQTALGAKKDIVDGVGTGGRFLTQKCLEETTLGDAECEAYFVAAVEWHQYIYLEDHAPLFCLPNGWRVSRIKAPFIAWVRKNTREGEGILALSFFLAGMGEVFPCPKSGMPATSPKAWTEIKRRRK